MRNVKQWIFDKPTLLALNASEYVFIAPEIYKFLHAFGEDEGRKRIKERLPLPPDIKDWVKMYETQSLKPILIEIIKNLKTITVQLNNLNNIASIPKITDINEDEIKKEAFRTPKALETDKEKDKKQKNNFWLKIIRWRLDLMKDEVTGADEEGIKELKKILPSPVIVYAIRVAIPCLLLYQQSPQVLFKEARSGKLDSLAKLLIVDKEILRDEIIFELFKDASRKEIDYNMLTKAIRQTPADMVTLKKVKVAVARFISDMSIFIGHRLTMNEIRDLYDSFEKDKQNDDAAIDEDGLYDSEDSFYRAVMRHSGYSHLFPPKSDKIF